MDGISSASTVRIETTRSEIAVAAHNEGERHDDKALRDIECHVFSHAIGETISSTFTDILVERTVCAPTVATPWLPPLSLEPPTNWNGRRQDTPAPALPPLHVYSACPAPVHQPHE
jgi:hypothetical protein